MNLFTILTLSNLARFIKLVPKYGLISRSTITMLSTFLKLYQKRKELLACTLPEVKLNSSDIHLFGNGPSLNATINNLDSVDKFSRKTCLCVNDFAIYDSYDQIRPKYYLLLDPAYWNNDVSFDLKKLRIKLFASIKTKTSWEMNLLLPITSAAILEKDKIFDGNTNIEINYFSVMSLSGYDEVRRYLFKHNCGMPHAQNVLVAAIFLAINIGYNRIYLHGADHSWLEDLVLNDENVVCLRDRHFYDEGDVKLIPWKKCDSRGSTWKMYEILGALSLMFKGYHELAEYAVYRNAVVYNASHKTYIDAFERYKMNVDDSCT